MQIPPHRLGLQEKLQNLFAFIITAIGGDSRKYFVTSSRARVSSLHEEAPAWRIPKRAL
jgi:hypothetical protein